MGESVGGRGWELDFKVLGLPQPQGSKRHVGRGIILESNKKLRPWRELVTYEAFHVKPNDWPTNLAYTVNVGFLFPRPKGHYGTGKNADRVKPSAPFHKTTMPDVDKCIRAILDSCTDAGIWKDDSQVVTVCGGKRYGESAFASIKIIGWE